MQSDSDKGILVREGEPAWSAPVHGFAQGAPLPRVVGGENDVLYMEDGHRCIDLFSGHGSVWLGHGNREIVERVGEQLKGAWNTGGLPTVAGADAAELIESFFPGSHYAAALYSTGMEAAEFAIRVARVATGRVGVVGFEGSMHGKSLATAYLGWDNGDALHLPGFHRLPFVQSASEDKILVQLEQVLGGGGVSAVFVEPIQGCSAGHAGSTGFYERVLEMCREHGAVSVFDEILTGFFRTGEAFCFARLKGVPDIVLIGKAMGNGFPVSGVVVNRRIAVQKSMLPGSTFAANPLAAAAVAATLKRMGAMPMGAMVAELEQIITLRLCPLRELGVGVRGKGAMWIIELPAGAEVWKIVAACYRRGVLAGCTGRQIRVLPPATIDLGNLELACLVLQEEVTAVLHGRVST
jgi:acetylornithine/succinyldiaminopimelate/putrescine aminotransferase